MALVADYDLKLYQKDVKTVFFNKNLEEEVYMNQYEGFAVKGKKRMMCKLNKSIYKLKQAFRYLKFNDVICKPLIILYIYSIRYKINQSHNLRIHIFYIIKIHTFIHIVR